MGHFIAIPLTCEVEKHAVFQRIKVGWSLKASSTVVFVQFVAFMHLELGPLDLNLMVDIFYYIINNFEIIYICILIFFL